LNPLQAHLEAREDRVSDQAQADDRWLRERAGIDPEERRRSFQSWVKGLLIKSLPMPADAARREKLLGQCAAEITVMCRQMRGRGWLLDGQALATEVKECIAPIAAYQRKGKVDDFYAYFRSCVRRYVDNHAEDLQALARRSGRDEATTTLADALAGLGIGRTAAPRAPSMVEIVSAHQPAKPAKRGRPRVADQGDQTMTML